MKNFLFDSGMYLKVAIIAEITRVNLHEGRNVLFSAMLPTVICVNLHPPSMIPLFLMEIDYTFIAL